MRICPNCGSILIWSFALKGCEYVCVPCVEGFPLFNDCEVRNIPEEEYQKLRKLYKDDLHKIGLQTAKMYGGKCNKCGDKFTCKDCQKAENHKLKYWGKGTVREC